jgi:hypothetical protein
VRPRRSRRCGSTGARPAALVDALIPFPFGDLVQPARERRRIAGKDVIAVTDSACGDVYAQYVYRNGDTVWLIEAEGQTLRQILAALP